MGELHLDIITLTVCVVNSKWNSRKRLLSGSYRETFRAGCEIEGSSLVNLRGRGQIRSRLIKEFELTKKVKDSIRKQDRRGVVPREYIPAVGAGLEEHLKMVS